MKKAITILAIILSLSAGAQTNKVDTVLAQKAYKYADSVASKTTVADFQKYLYSVVPAKEFNEKIAPVFQLMQNYLQSVAAAWYQKEIEKRKK